MDVLKEATGFLKIKDIKDPRLNAERLMCHVLGLSRIDLYLRFEQPLSREEREAYKTLLRRRATHEPIQYILGETEFMSLPFKVTPDVLIPRPETEILVEKVVEEIGNQKEIKLLDIGVGSGNIVVSLAKYLMKAEVVGVDIDEKVLSLAATNARMNGVEERIRFIKADVREGDFAGAVEPPFDVVVSNPPYVSSEEWDVLPNEIRKYEPPSALCDDGDGLAFFEVIARRGNEVLMPDGMIFFEVGDRQSEAVQAILKGSEYSSVEVFLDLNGIERIVMGKRC